MPKTNRNFVDSHGLDIAKIVENIDVIRRYLGMSKTEFKRELHLTTAEYGRVFPRIDDLMRVTNKVGIKIDDVLNKKLVLKIEVQGQPTMREYEQEETK